ncbi:MAG TPA: hypothetical protein VMM12_06120 [Longimicrobiales bacterium]|nr:hypothetical protein [Longimicrobiales bacterium]
MTETRQSRTSTFLPRPVGLTLLTWLLGFWAGAALLALAGLWLGEGDVLMNGKPTPRPLVREMLVPMLLPMALATGGAAAALWLDSAWARPATLFAFLLAGPLATYPRWEEATNPGGAPLLGLLVIAPLLVGLGWYLYAKPNVAAYFRALTEARLEGRL